jgi:hypothetical protein
MRPHKFKVGDIVALEPAVSRNVPGGVYVVIKHLPANGEHQYRIAGKLAPGNLGLFQQHRPDSDISGLGYQGVGFRYHRHSIFCDPPLTDTDQMQIELELATLAVSSTLA